MGVEFFIKIESAQNPIKGESLDSKLRGADGWSALQSFTIGASNKVSLGSTVATDKVVFDDLEITKLVDAASPRLFAALCTGARLETVTIAVRKAGGVGETTEPNLEYKFAMVLVTGIDTNVGHGEAAPAETIKFAYGAAQVAYRPLDSLGKLSAPISQAWSRILDKPTLAVK